MGQGSLQSIQVVVRDRIASQQPPRAAAAAAAARARARTHAA
jgi:hypothetical protein